MKKLISALLVLILLMTALCACNGGTNISPDTSDQKPEPSEAEESALPSEVDEADEADISEDASKADIYDPYPVTDIPDNSFTAADGGKIFDSGKLSLQIPSDWKATEQHGEDGGFYRFMHPELSEKCELVFESTFAELLGKKRTEAEYLSYLSSILEDVKIGSFTLEKLCGYDCTRVVSSYSEQGETFIRVDYDYIVAGAALYSFTATYPEAKKDTYAPVFDAIINSIKIKNS